MKYRIMDVLVNSFIVLVFGFLPILAILMAGCILSDNADMPIASIFGAWATLAVLVLACLLVIAYAILDCLKPKKEHEYVATGDLDCVRFKDDCEWHESALLLTEDEIIVASAKKGDRFVLRRLDEKAHGLFKFALFDRNYKPVAFFVSKKSVSAKSKYERPLFETLRKNTRRLKRLERERYDHLAVGFPREKEAHAPTEEEWKDLGKESQKE